MTRKSPPPGLNRSQERSGEIRKNFTLLAKSRLPVWIVCFLALLHIPVFIGGGAESMSTWYESLGLRRESVFSGKIWQIFTYSLLHGNWLHLGLNCLCVFLLGTKIEHIIGSAELMKILAAGVLGGALGHFALAPAGPESPLLVGFSGAVVALLLWNTTISPESHMWPLPVSGRSLGLGILLGEWFLAMIDPSLNIPGFSKIGNALVEQGMGAWFQIGHACHFGGGMAGWVMARWLLRPRTTLKSLRRERARLEAGNDRFR